jgi:hypothetical protein
VKTPVIIAGIVLLALAALLFWDSSRQELPEVMAPAVPVSAPAPQLPRISEVSSDEDLRIMKEALTVESIVIETPNVTPRGLAELVRFPALRSVELHQVPVNDAGVAALKKARQINRLIMMNAGLDSNQISSLAACENLLEFGLRDERPDLSAMAAIGQMQQLKTLLLDGSSIGDQDLDHLQALPNLTLLSLAGTAVTSEGMVKLEKFEHIRELNLAGTGVGKAALVHFARMQQLEVLRIPHTHIGPACLNEIKQLKRVRVLELSTNFTLHALIELRQALPRTLVYNEQPGL